MGLFGLDLVLQRLRNFDGNAFTRHPSPISAWKLLPRSRSKTSALLCKSTPKNIVRFLFAHCNSSPNLRDEDDNHFVELIITCNADYFVSI